MSFAVQILNYNNFKVTIMALQSIIETGHKNLHIYILDNGSSNISFKEIRRYIQKKKIDTIVSIKHTKQNLGFSGGHNYIFEWIKDESSKEYQYHLILNSDAFLPNNFFYSVIKHLNQEKKYYPLYGFVIDDPDSPKNSSVIQSWNKFFGFSLKHKEPKLVHSNFFYQYFPSGAALLIDSKYLTSHGLFDEKFFFYGEEVDLCKKIHDNGFDFRIYDDIKITHSYGQSTFNKRKKRNLFNEFYYQRSKLILMAKYHPNRILLVRLTILAIIFWRCFQGYFSHIPLLLKLIFIPIGKLEKLRFSDLKYDRS